MTAYQINPSDRLADGGLILPWPGAQVGRAGQVVAVEIRGRVIAARIRWARKAYTIADEVRP